MVWMMVVWRMMMEAWKRQWNRDHNEVYFWWWKRHHHRHRHHHVRVLFTVGTVGILLAPNKEAFLMTDITLGHGLDLSITYLDQNGNPMLVTPTPDAPATWTQTNPETETLVVGADGNTAATTSIAVGSDSIGLSVTVGGATYTASLIVNVTEVPQVLTGVAINAVVT